MPPRQDLRADALDQADNHHRNVEICISHIGEIVEQHTHRDLRGLQRWIAGCRSVGRQLSGRWTRRPFVLAVALHHPAEAGCEPQHGVGFEAADRARLEPPFSRRPGTPRGRSSRPAPPTMHSVGQGLAAATEWARWVPTNQPEQPAMPQPRPPRRHLPLGAERHHGHHRRAGLRRLCEVKKFVDRLHQRVRPVGPRVPDGRGQPLAHLRETLCQILDRALGLGNNPRFFSPMLRPLFPVSSAHSVAVIFSAVEVRGLDRRAASTVRRLA